LRCGSAWPGLPCVRLARRCSYRVMWSRAGGAAQVKGKGTMHTWLLNVPDVSGFAEDVVPDQNVVWELSPEPVASDRLHSAKHDASSPTPTGAAVSPAVGNAQSGARSGRKYSIEMKPAAGGVHLPLSVTLSDLDSGCAAAARACAAPCAPVVTLRPRAQQRRPARG
jgi:hypothetical protein